jgi:glycine cleavage system aminomethyltransferase T
MHAPDATRTKAARKGPLDELLRAAGARMVARHGRAVPADFGSPDGELAACRDAVGLVDRSDRATLEVRGEPDALDEVVRRLTGGPLDRGTALHVRREWWCRVSPEQLLIRCEPAHVDAARYAVCRETTHIPGAVVHDASDEWAAVGVVGPRAEGLLRDLGLAEGEPLREVRVEDVPAILLREEEHRFELIEAREDAPAVWNRLREAGRGHGVSFVGTEALEQLAR